MEVVFVVRYVPIPWNLSVILEDMLWFTRVKNPMFAIYVIILQFKNLQWIDIIRIGIPK